jgi:hypothetical protein
VPKPIETIVARPNPSSAGCVVRWALVFVLLLGALSVEVFAGKIGDTTITLQSQKYYKGYDMTRLKYRVKTSRRGELPSHWVLELGECVTEESILWWASSWFDWVEEPFRGIRFEIQQSNQTYYVWLVGRWDVGEVGAACVYGGYGYGYYRYPYDETVLTGTIDGPICAGSSIAVEVLSGESVGFPPVLQTGRYDGDTVTMLRVTSTSAGWSLDRSLVLSIPAQAQEDVVRRVFEVTVEPYQPAAGETDIEVAYAVDIADTDLAGLPEGSYVIAVAYTVTVDD